MPKKIPYEMDTSVWQVIVKDGIARGHKPVSTEFYVDIESLTGMMWYYGVPWLFPVRRKK